MENHAVFLDCPAYLGGSGAVRCGLPAEVEERYSASSTDGPLDSARIRCPRGHWFNGHIESLTMPGDRPRPVYQHGSSLPLYPEGMRGADGMRDLTRGPSTGRG
jgi:hypothetical protein